MSQERSESGQGTDAGTAAPRSAEGDDEDRDKTIPADKTAPGVDEVEIGGESLDP